MATDVETETIVRGEDRNVRFSFATLPTGAAGWTYALKIYQTTGGDPVITKTFGAADYSAGDEEWNFTIAAASTALLSYGRIAEGYIWRTDSGFAQVVAPKKTMTVG